MLTGYSALGEITLGELPSDLDTSVANPLAMLMADPDARLVFVLVASPPSALVGPAYGLPYALGDVPLGALDDEDAAGPATLYLSDVGFTTGADDTPPNTIMPPVLSEPYSFESSLALDGSGAADSAFGAIRILNGDADRLGDAMPQGEMDALLDKAWSGWPIEIRVGGTFNLGRADERTLKFSEFGLFFKGTAGSPTATRDEIVLPIRNPMARLETTLNERVYAGTGGLEGDAAVAGVNKPRGWGQVRHATPVLINALLRIYQYNDGPVLSLDAAQDNGVDLPVDADYPTYEALAAAVIPLGSCASCKALGLARHSTTPVGEFTVDFKGDASGGGYVSSAPAIARRMAVTCGASPLSDPEEIDAVAFADVGLAAPFTVNFYTGGAVYTVAEAIREVMASVGGFATFDRVGRLSVGILAEPSDAPVATHTSADFAEDPIEVESIEPVYRWVLGYRRNHTVQQADALGAISADLRRDYSQAERLTAPAEASGVRAMFPLALDRKASTLLDVEADANAERDRRLRRDKVARRLYSIDLLLSLFQPRLAETRRLEYHRLGLAAGKSGVVATIAESARRRVASLKLMG